MSMRTPTEFQNEPFVPSKAPVLTEDETKRAVEVLYDNSFTRNFPTVERRFTDPTIINQTLCLVTFVPAAGATPDESGCFGMMKVRGTFGNIEDADQKAADLIQNVDSTNTILTAYVGRPFPLIKPGEGEKYGASLQKIDVDKKTAEVIDNNTKAKREQDRKEINEIKEREKRLKEDVKQESTNISDDEKYTMLRVKRSQLIFTYVEAKNKLVELKKLIEGAQEEITVMDEKDSTLKDVYINKYLYARRECGIPEKDDETFMKYMGDDVDLQELFTN